MANTNNKRKRGKDRRSRNSGDSATAAVGGLTDVTYPVGYDPAVIERHEANVESHGHGWAGEENILDHQAKIRSGKSSYFSFSSTVLLFTASDPVKRIKKYPSTCSVTYGIVDGQTLPCWSIIDPNSLCTTAFGFEDTSSHSAVSQFITEMTRIGYVLLDTSTGYYEQSKHVLSEMYQRTDFRLDFIHTPQYAPKLERTIQVTPSMNKEEAMALRIVKAPMPQVSYNNSHKIQYRVTLVSKSRRGDTSDEFKSGRQVIKHILNQQSKTLNSELNRIYQEFVDNLGTSNSAQGGRWPLACDTRAGQKYYIIKCFIPANENA